MLVKTTVEGGKVVSWVVVRSSVEVMRIVEARRVLVKMTVEGGCVVSSVVVSRRVKIKVDAGIVVGCVVVSRGSVDVIKIVLAPNVEVMIIVEAGRVVSTVDASCVDVSRSVLVKTSVLAP